MTALEVLAGQNHQAKPCASMSEQPRRGEPQRTTVASAATAIGRTEHVQPESTGGRHQGDQKSRQSLKPLSVSALTPEESDRATTQPMPSRTCAAERGTKPITAKGSESEKQDRCTPSEPLNSTPSQPHSTQAETTADSEPNRENILSVRRLTPTECEVLQGFPKGWTLPDTALLGTL